MLMVPEKLATARERHLAKADYSEPFTQLWALLTHYKKEAEQKIGQFAEDQGLVEDDVLEFVEYFEISTSRPKLIYEGDCVTFLETFDYLHEKLNYIRNTVISLPTQFYWQAVEDFVSYCAAIFLMCLTFTDFGDHHLMFGGLRFEPTEVREERNETERLKIENLVKTFEAQIFEELAVLSEPLR